MAAVLSNPPGNRYTDALEEYRRVPYLLGCDSWKEFVARYGRPAQETPFALVLQTSPKPDTYIMPTAPLGTPRHVFFGILTTQHRDDRLGRHCFCRESEDFGGARGSGPSVAVYDGLDPLSLKVPAELVHDIERGLRSEGFYKISRLYTDPKQVMSMLVAWMSTMAQRIPSYLDCVVSGRLVKTCNTLQEYLKLCGEAGKGAEVVQALEPFRTGISLREKHVTAEFRELMVLARQKHHEVRNLRKVGK